MRKISVFGLLLPLFLIYFVSCTDDTDVVKPTIDLIGGAFISADKTVEPGADLPFKWTATKGDAKLETFTIYKDGAIIPEWNQYEIPNSQSDSYTGADTLIAPQNEGEYTYTFEVTDKDGYTAEVSVKIKVQSATTTTPLSAEKDFTWQRVGSAAGTGLSQFGLSWTSNTATAAVIKKDADKFVELQSSQWTSITTFEALKAAVDAATDMTQWTGVSATQASKTYDVVLGTKKGDAYFLIHVTNSTVTTNTSGTTITITGKYKEKNQ